MKTVYTVIYYSPNDGGSDAIATVDGIFESKEDAEKYVSKQRYSFNYEIRDWYPYYEKGCIQF